MERLPSLLSLVSRLYYEFISIVFHCNRQYDFVVFTNLIAVVFVVSDTLNISGSNFDSTCHTLTDNYIYRISKCCVINNDIVFKNIGRCVYPSINFISFSSQVKVKIPANQLTASIAGVVAGLMNGFLSIPGPPVVLYYSAAIEDKKEYIATVQFLFLTNSILKIVFFTTTYGVSDEIARYIPFTIVAAIVGTYLGNKAFKKLSSDNLKRVVYLVMILAGIKYLLF